MFNKKTIALKETLRGQIIREILNMAPAELAKMKLTMDQILANRVLEEMLSQIGKVYEVLFTNGRKTLSVILTQEGIINLGIDLNTVFIKCGGREEFNENTDVRNGVLVNLDLYQQATLLREIIERKPKLQEVLGLYNLRGSIKVYGVLNRAGVPRQLGIWWMWTAERFVQRQKAQDYPEEKIILLSHLPALKGNRFVSRNFIGDHCEDNNPGIHNCNGAVVFGAHLAHRTSPMI